MFTRKALNTHIENFIADLKAAGYAPSRVVLFGSYAYGKPHQHSDIDLAVWDNKFTGCGSVDVAPIASVISRYERLELHAFAAGEPDDPFAHEINRVGKLILGS